MASFIFKAPPVIPVPNEYVPDLSDGITKERPICPAARILFCNFQNFQREQQRRPYAGKLGDYYLAETISFLSDSDDVPQYDLLVWGYCGSHCKWELIGQCDYEQVEAKLREYTRDFFTEEYISKHPHVMHPNKYFVDRACYDKHLYDAESEQMLERAKKVVEAHVNNGGKDCLHEMISHAVHYFPSKE